MLGLSFSQSPNSINYTINHGLPSNTVYCIIQDNHGFIWLGTDAGLSRFDGVEFRNYGLKEGLPDMDILSFFNDSQNRIWFYTYNGRVGYLKDGRIYNSKNESFLKNADFKSRISSIVESQGKIYVSALVDGIKILNETTTDSLKFDGFTYYLAELDGKCSWVIISGHDVKYAILEVDKLIELDSQSYSNLKLIGQGKHYFSYLKSFDELIYTCFPSLNHGLMKIDPQKKAIEKFIIPDTKIYNFDISEDDFLLFTDKGIKSLDPHVLKSTDILNLEETTSSILDNEGNRWVSTLDKGVFFLPKNEVKKHADLEIEGLSTFNDSILYLVHSDNKVGYIDHDKVIDLYEVPSSYLKSIYVDSLQDIWTLHSTFFYKNGRIYDNRFKATNTSFLKGHVFIFQLPNGMKYIHLLDGTEMDFAYHQIGKIRDLEFLSDEEILIASSRGLFMMDLGKNTIKSYRAFDNLQIADIDIDRYDFIWVATNGLGLLRIKVSSLYDLNPDQLNSFRITNYSNVYGKTLVIDTVIYASSPQGVSKFYFDDNTIYKHAHITESNGLIPARVNDIKYFKSDIFIGQDNGLFTFPHSQNFDESMDFPIIIDEVIADDSLFVKTEGTISLPYDVGPIQINTKTVYFKNHRNLAYQFRLIKDNELEPTWSSSPNNEFIFSKLSPGDYTFQVRSKSINSEWSAPKDLRFHIDNIFWQTQWFLLVVTFAFLFFVYLIYFFVSKAKRNRQMLMRAKIESDIKALKAQINPHFLFNSINSIQTFILEGKTSIADSYLVKYGKLMRTILNHSNSLTVPIHEEIDAMKLYVELEKLRLYRPLDFEILVDENIDIYIERIPSMIVQPIIENSIWHGIQPSVSANKILLTFELKGNQIFVKVEDDGVGFTSNGDLRNNPHGIQLIEERISLINKLQGVESKFEINSDELGTKVTFCYPSLLSY